MREGGTDQLNGDVTIKNKCKLYGPARKMQDTHDVKCCILFKISIKHFGGNLDSF